MQMHCAYAGELRHFVQISGFRWVKLCSCHPQEWIRLRGLFDFLLKRLKQSN